MSGNSPFPVVPGNTLRITDEKCKISQYYPVMINAGKKNYYSHAKIADLTTSDITDSTLMGINISALDVSEKDIQIRGPGQVRIMNTSNYPISVGDRVGIFAPSLFSGADDALLRKHFMETLVASESIPALVAPIGEVDSAELIVGMINSKITPAYGEPDIPPMKNDAGDDVANFFAHRIKNASKEANKTGDPLAKFTSTLFRNLMVQSRNVIRVLGNANGGAVLDTDFIAAAAPVGAGIANPFDNVSITALGGTENRKDIGTGELFGAANQTFTYGHHDQVPKNLWTLFEKGKTTKKYTIELLNAYDDVKHSMIIGGIAMSHAESGQDFSIVIN